MATTIKDIAKKCGVGVSTVSRAINNHPDINPETRAKVMKVIRETGFVPNDSARFLKRTETNSVALLVKGITNPFFTKMIRIMEEYIQEKDYATILRHVDHTEDEVVVAESLIKERRLKGIVFLGGAFTHDEKALRALGVPFIFATIGNMEKIQASVKAAKKSGFAYANIAVDDVEEAKKAVNYLIGEGHHRIGIVTEGMNVPSVGQLRLKGYREALEENGLPYSEDLVYEVKEGIDHYTMPNGYQAAQALMRKNPDMTAIFCISDVLAFGACRAIIDEGRKIPDDISVVGYDGIEEGEYYNPRLTTVRQPVDQMAENAIEFLFCMIEKKRKPENMTMSAELVIRESSGAAKKG
ncbi:transcriptional regulator, LacI family [Lachnospiraceae bacterium NK3A20]|nr:transcriptional regulator, LacI family [Lachnospiraceae bacterium NK3A20]